MQAHELLLKGFHTAVAAADPLKIIPAYLPTRSALGNGRTLVIGAGKLGQRLVRSLGLHPEFGLTIRGYLSRHPAPLPRKRPHLPAQRPAARRAIQPRGPGGRWASGRRR